MSTRASGSQWSTWPRTCAGWVWLPGRSPGRLTEDGFTSAGARIPRLVSIPTPTPGSRPIPTAAGSARSRRRKRRGYRHPTSNGPVTGASPPGPTAARSTFGRDAMGRGRSSPRPRASGTSPSPGTEQTSTSPPRASASAARGALISGPTTWASGSRVRPHGSSQRRRSPPTRTRGCVSSSSS